MAHLRSKARVGAGAALAVALFALVALWLWSPWPTEAARYVWRQWREPHLAILLDRSDAALALEIGNYYYGTVIIGRATPRYNPALAERAFERAVAINPAILWGHYSLARIYFAKGNFDEALHEANEELAANPANLRTLYVRGLIYGYRGLPRDLYLAETDFKRFTEWAPTEWAGYNDLAWVLAKEGKYVEIESVIETAFVRVPAGRENPWLLNMLGTARLNLSDRAGAKAAFGEALRYAEALTSADWRQAYSGNDPATDAEGLDAFISTLKENLAKAS
jgi:tetratricopeptide (TPR) repeat protein